MQGGASKELHGANKQITYFFSALKKKKQFVKESKIICPKCTTQKACSYVSYKVGTTKGWYEYV